MNSGYATPRQSASKTANLSYPYRTLTPSLLSRTGLRRRLRKCLSQVAGDDALRPVFVVREDFRNNNPPTPAVPPPQNQAQEKSAPPAPTQSHDQTQTPAPVQPQKQKPNASEQSKRGDLASITISIQDILPPEDSLTRKSIFTSLPLLLAYLGDGSANNSENPAGADD